MGLSDGKLLGTCMQGTQEGLKREGLREGIMYLCAGQHFGGEGGGRGGRECLQSTSGRDWSIGFTYGGASSPNRQMVNIVCPVGRTVLSNTLGGSSMLHTYPTHPCQAYLYEWCGRGSGGCWRVQRY